MACIISKVLAYTITLYTITLLKKIMLTIFLNCNSFVYCKICSRFLLLWRITVTTYNCYKCKICCGISELKRRRLYGETSNTSFLPIQLSNVTMSLQIYVKVLLLPFSRLMSIFGELSFPIRHKRKKTIPPFFLELSLILI